MPIDVRCECGKSITVPDRYAGRSGTCKSCGSKLLIPETVPPTPARPPAADVAPPPLPAKPMPPIDDFSPSAVPSPPEDEVLYSARPAMFRAHPFQFTLGAALAIAPFPLLFVSRVPLEARVIALLLPLLIPPFFLAWWLRCLNTRLTITRKKISLRKGILAKALNEVRIADVRNVKTTQGFLQRLFGVGYVGVSTAGQSDLEIEVNGMPHPNRIRETIDQQRG